MASKHGRKGNKYWAADFVMVYPDGRTERVRKRSPVQSKQGAEEFEEKLRKQLLSRTGKKEIPLFKDFVKKFLENYAEVKNKPSEVRMKRSTFQHHLVPRFGNLRIDRIDAESIEAYAAKKLAAGKSPKTINNHLTMLRKTLVKAADWGYLHTVPKVTWLKYPDPEFDFFDFEEADRLLEAADREWRTMLLTALKTGMRVGELLALQWDSVDLVAGRIVVRRSDWRGHVGTPKNGKSREVPISPVLLAALKAHRHLKGDMVFCPDGEDGRPFRENELRRPLYRACKKAGLRRIGWHVLRHTFASHLVMRGVPLKAVQELMGHSTMEMTMRYAHLSPDVRRDAVAKLDAPHDSKAAEGERS